MHFIFSSCTPAVVIERSRCGVGGTGVILDYWDLVLERKYFIVKEHIGYSEAAEELFGGWD